MKKLTNNINIKKTKLRIIYSDQQKWNTVNINH